MFVAKQKKKDGIQNNKLLLCGEEHIQTLFMYIFKNHTVS